MAKRNIAIFIPHQGCKHDCAFCNQRSITGQLSPPTPEMTRKIIEENLATLGNAMPQIAFFGGSFTGIGNDLMEQYLRIADEYVKKGAVEGIRLSTRPDYIDEEILNILKKYAVTNIELGAQSLDDEVLRLSNRGHDSECVRRAARLINEYGFVLGLQMMISLPGDTFERSVATAREFVRLGAKETRIYPTVVIEHTHLADMMRSGEYVPMAIENIIDCAAECVDIFNEADVKILRIGLQNSTGLQGEVVGGAYHDALGERVCSRVIRRACEKNQGGEIRYGKSFVSKVVGQKKENMTYFKEHGINVRLILDESMKSVMVNGKTVLS